jgi:hypothetical protein
MKLGEHVKIKPSNGIQIRKPDGSFLAAEGETVVITSYWLRRSNDGDIERAAVQEQAADIAEPSKPKTKG